MRRSIVELANDVRCAYEAEQREAKLREQFPQAKHPRESLRHHTAERRRGLERMRAELAAAEAAWDGGAS